MPTPPHLFGQHSGFSHCGCYSLNYYWCLFMGPLALNLCPMVLCRAIRIIYVVTQIWSCTHKLKAFRAGYSPFSSLSVLFCTWYQRVAISKWIPLTFCILLGFSQWRIQQGTGEQEMGAFEVCFPRGVLLFPVTFHIILRSDSPSWLRLSWLPSPYLLRPGSDHGFSMLLCLSTSTPFLGSFNSTHTH